MTNGQLESSRRARVERGARVHEEFAITTDPAATVQEDISQLLKEGLQLFTLTAVGVLAAGCGGQSPQLSNPPSGNGIVSEDKDPGPEPDVYELSDRAPHPTISTSLSDEEKANILKIYQDAATLILRYVPELREIYDKERLAIYIVPNVGEAWAEDMRALGQIVEPPRSTVIAKTQVFIVRVTGENRFRVYLEQDRALRDLPRATSALMHELFHVLREPEMAKIGPQATYKQKELPVYEDVGRELDRIAAFWKRTGRPAADVRGLKEEAIDQKRAAERLRELK